MAVAHLSGLKWLSLLPYLPHRSATQYAPSQVTNPNVFLLSDVLDMNPEIYLIFFFFRSQVTLRMDSGVSVRETGLQAFCLAVFL